MSNSDYASQKLATVQMRIHRACASSGRPQESVRLVGASKRQDPALVSEFVEAGLEDLGENYLQEAINKQQDLPNLNANWHFIGQIQSNKTKQIAQHFNWVHGVDRLKIAQRLATQHQRSSPINLLIQLNVDKELSKGGVSIDQAPELCQQIAEIGVPTYAAL